MVMSIEKNSSTDDMRAMSSGVCNVALCWFFLDSHKSDKK